MIGVLLSFEILFPLAVAGFSFPLGVSRLFPGALLVSLTHLGLAVFFVTVTFFIFGFAPKKRGGWLFLLLPALLIAGGLVLSLPGIPGFAAAKNIPSATPNSTRLPSNTPLPPATSTMTATLPVSTHTATLTLTQTISPSDTQTPTLTQTPQPTTFYAIIDAQQGVVIRESPTFDAPVAGYLNDGDAIEILDLITSEEGSLWYRVTTPDGQVGWLLASLTNTQTPTPTPE